MTDSQSMNTTGWLVKERDILGLSAILSKLASETCRSIRKCALSTVLTPNVIKIAASTSRWPNELQIHEPFQGRRQSASCTSPWVQKFPQKTGYERRYKIGHVVYVYMFIYIYTFICTYMCIYIPCIYYIIIYIYNIYIVLYSCIVFLWWSLLLVVTSLLVVSFLITMYIININIPEGRCSTPPFSALSCGADVQIHAPQAIRGFVMPTQGS
jgi:hypothetical protein